MFTLILVLVVMLLIAVGVALIIATLWLGLLALWTNVHIPSALAVTALLSLLLFPVAGAIGYAVIQDRKHWVDLQPVGGLILLEAHMLVALVGANFGWMIWKSGRLYAARSEPVRGAGAWAKAGFAGMIGNGVALVATLAAFLAAL
jgi:hypothetical protein